jgi:tRNA-dihydrouridine synthase B
MKNDQNIGKGILSIGGIPLTGRALMAPLSGVTDVVFRQIALRLGASLVISEMVASDEYLNGSEETRLRAEGAGMVPHIVQLAGCEPYHIGEAARLAEQSGAHMIDLNMGCPAKKVTGGWSGSALMREPERALSLVRAAIGAVRIPVTVKMRLGWDDASLNAADLASAAEKEGASAVTVHGRTRCQFYKGQANWAAIAAVKDVVTIPVIANGDIATIADARACLALSKADAVMIGRAAIGRPWMVGQIADQLEGREPLFLSLQQKADIALEHYTGLLHLYGIDMGLRHARKHVAAYLDEAVISGAGLSHERRNEALTSTDPHHVQGLLQEAFIKSASKKEAA